MKIIWAGKVSNSDVLVRLCQKSASVDCARKSRWIRHVLQRKGLLLTVLEGCVVRRNYQRRKRFQTLDVLMREVM